MSHFADFLEDVSVKISEKYKRFPKIYLPYTVNESITRAQSVVDASNAPIYSCTFERNVLAKLKELRNAKETKKNERRHRLQLLQEAEQKRLDAIAAAEEEERLKQLSVSEVSYPSTEEISAPSPEVKAAVNCDNNAIDVTPEKIDDSSINLPVANLNNEPDLNILQPTLVSSHYPENNLLDDPDPLQNFKLNNKITKLANNSNIDNLTFRDFENDTSSPFDNVELKTINDMELLAQVLQSQKDSTITCHQQPGCVTEPSYPIPTCATQAQLEGTNYLPATYLEQPIQGPSMMYNTPQHYPITNGYYVPTDVENVNVYMPEYNYYVPTNAYPEMNQYYGGQLPMTSNFNPAGTDSAYVQPQFYYQYPNLPVQYQTPDASTVYGNTVPNENTEPNITSISQNTIKSRSRSVPDIVRELNEELAKLKMTERSYNASPAPKNVQESLPQPSTVNGKKTERTSKKKTVHLPNPFDKLPVNVQEVCKKIHGMGFPLDRVARVCTLVGVNDKKIIEALLILGDLMDLGFPEDKVSAALAKHQFHRDKALDELVS